MLPSLNWDDAPTLLPSGGLSLTYPPANVRSNVINNKCGEDDG